MSRSAEIVPFIDATYREALTLTREARGYVMDQRERRNPVGDHAASLRVSCETMRLTARLTQVMSWLMVQKAVHAGEIDREEARKPEYRLSGQDVCMEEVLEFEQEQAPELNELLERSLRLYQRVARLDAMHDQSGHDQTG